MISARVERAAADKFANEVIGNQSILTLQDFMGYALELANRRVIIIDEQTNKFKLNPEYVNDPQ